MQRQVGSKKLRVISKKGKLCTVLQPSAHATFEMKERDLVGQYRGDAGNLRP